MIKTVIFDLDDTLFDFKRSERVALTNTLIELGIEPREETLSKYSEINDGQPFEVIFPETGSPYSLTGTAMIDGREKNSDIVEVYEFIINEFLVYDKENFSPENIYEGQKNNIENYPEGIVYADMTGIQEIKEKERLLELWKY